MKEFVARSKHRNETGFSVCGLDESYSWVTFLRLTNTLSIEGFRYQASEVLEQVARTKEIATKSNCKDIGVPFFYLIGKYADTGTLERGRKSFLRSFGLK